jgi:hypothetical protein
MVKKRQAGDKTGAVSSRSTRDEHFSTGPHGICNTLRCRTGNGFVLGALPDV